jgi:hypothetical protein
MSTHDPFLRSVGVVVDRVIVVLVLTSISTCLLWDAASRAALDLTHGQAAIELLHALMGVAPPVMRVVAELCLLSGSLISAVLASWLFRRWKGRAQMSSGHVRGPRLEG